MTITPTGNYSVDQYGFLARDAGFGLDAIMGVIEYTDDGTPVVIGVIPRGAILLPPQVNVIVAFDDTGTDLLDIGKAGDGDAYALNLDVSSAGQIVTGMIATAFDGVPLTAETEINMQYDGSNSDASAGKALIYFPFFRTG